MKVFRLLIGATAGALALSMKSAEETVAPEALPPAVRATLSASHLGSFASPARRTVVDGRTVYVFEIEKANAPYRTLRIAEDGSYVREEPVPLLSMADLTAVLPPPVMETQPRIELEDLPRPVQETVRRESKGRLVGGITRETRNGRPVFVIEFRTGETTSRLLVDDAGGMVPEREPRRDRPDRS